MDNDLNWSEIWLSRYIASIIPPLRPVCVATNAGDRSVPDARFRRQLVIAVGIASALSSVSFMLILAPDII
jgi:hypothetical protein